MKKLQKILKRIAEKVPKKPLGIIFVVLGILALVTPFTPGSWLVFVGLELLGVRYLFRDKVDALLIRFGVKKGEGTQSDKQVDTPTVDQ